METLPDENETPLLLSSSSPPASPAADSTIMSTAIMKNSTIPVNVDDLGSGLIVVTFTHSSGTLYQGVLLQLNRERGIPCGISFPKDYCSTIPTNPTEFEDENEQPPVQQRHTYFHTSPTTAPKPLRRFNRATKPPARYKNGRLALRLRHRPVLCSKCKAYCEEKNPPKNSKDSSLENEDLGGTGGVTTRNNEVKSKSSDRKISPLAPQLNSNGSLNSVEEAEDCTYSVAGPKNGLVDNYWKRPVPPLVTNSTLTENTRQAENDDGKINAIKDLEKNMDTSRLILSLKSTENNQVPNSILINQSEDEKHPSDALQTKKQNLRVCISKLQLHNQSLQLNHRSDEEKAESVDSLGAIIESSAARRSSRRDPIVAMENSRKRSTTVPARFRDEACITKNVFDFKRRRQGSNKDVSGFNHRLMPPLKPASVPITPKPPPLTLNPSYKAVNTVETETSNAVSLPPLPILIPRRSLSLTPKSDVSRMPKSEVSRTPTIKISYGSSGQGVVIEIPSKPTVESSSENQISPDKSKAEKKALRKARKQAKRKLSMVPEDCGSEKSALSNSFELSSSQSSCSSPPPPLLTPISELCPLIIDEDYPTTLDQCPPLIHFTKEIPLTPKKRKKEKKHKKYKVKQEDTPSIVS